MAIVLLKREAGVIYDFNQEHEPVLRVKSGTRVEIEAYDCFQNQVTSPETMLSEIDWNKINPATGPISIEGAQPGDVLKVTIEKLEVANRGVMATGPNLDVLGHRLNKLESKIVPVREGQIEFGHVKIPLRPMIGVIGVAPEGEGIPCGTPGRHGGNMDTTLVTEGATLYFPVFVEGALFACGDFHAAMGDGEVGVSGVEVEGRVIVQLEVVKGEKLNHPLLENDEKYALIVSAPTLDEAAKTAAEEMVDRITEKSGMPASEVVMLLSAAGHVEVSQIVDPLMTARFSVPKAIIQQMGIRLI